MKRFLCFSAFVLSFFSVHAQSQDIREEVQRLVQRVDSLEHELSYLNLTYELNTLNSDITIFADEVYTRFVAIKLDISNRNFNSELGDSYQQYYESCQNKKQSISELIEVKSLFFNLKVVTSSYSEDEVSMLKTRYNVINNAYDVLEHSMNLLRFIVDEYNRFL